jgi:hypothetical protein
LSGLGRQALINGCYEARCPKAALGRTRTVSLRLSRDCHISNGDNVPAAGLKRYARRTKYSVPRTKYRAIEWICGPVGRLTVMSRYSDKRVTLVVKRMTHPRQPFQRLKGRAYPCMLGSARIPKTFPQPARLAWQSCAPWSLRTSGIRARWWQRDVEVPRAYCRVASLLRARQGRAHRSTRWASFRQNLSRRA